MSDTDTFLCYFFFHRLKLFSDPLYSMEEKVETIVGIDMLRSHGISLGRPWVAPLGKGLWELRIRSRRQLRILYFLHTEKTFVLLHGFVKKTREVPQSEIQIAARRMKQYLGR